MTTFVLHDETVNTHGFRMLTSGANLDEFRKNPVMLLNHNDWGLPIGRWENIRVDGTKILADAVFDDKDPVGRQVKEKVENNFLRAASVGAWPPDEISEEPFLRMAGQTGPTVVRWTVREASIVSIPANHNAVVFYDRATGDPLDMKDTQIIKLFDIKSLSQKNEMKDIAKLLNLADTASEADVAAALQIVLGDVAGLKAENETLKTQISDLNKAAKERMTSEAVSLVDAAVKDGRIEAKAKDAYLKLFDVDFESAKTTLEGIPTRQSVASQIEAARQSSNTELADLQKASWDDLDKKGRLVMLKDKYPELYAEKYEAKFGIKPKV